MPKPTISWNKNAFYNLRRGPKVVRELESRGRRIAAAAGDGFAVDSHQGARRPEGRWRVTVFAATAKAKRRNATDNTLVKALGAGRGR
ncbi:hypothetical protein [Nocardia terpenica]|uniref:Uncharacterized protein n=1 Tax=Nocardia terpenica TaxID=455432 RepID=A0A291RCU8_9NOCA|nr:hypothetical protein [Nocardia terpenica]ATL65140.1 hypothetical protein CRH09_01740 [Nocardia terpenica]